MKFWLLLTTLLLAPVLWADEDAEIEAASRLKAEIIDRFTLFVTWPAPETSAAKPFVIGVYGRDPLTDSLRELVRGHRIQERPVRLVEISDLERIDSCQVLFIAGSESAELPRILARTAERPILTIGDTEGFARRGVLINLYRDGDYVRFEINTEAVARSGLRFGSQLLRLGRLVSSDDGGEEP